MNALREILAAFSIEVEDDELKKASKHIEGFVGKLQAVAPVLAEAFAIGALTEFVASTVEAGARVFDLSAKLGVGTEELQQFQFAAKLAGVEGESAAHSLGFLNKAVGEALTGSKEASETFQKMGIPLKDAGGNARETGDILLDVSDALEKMPDQQTRAAYAMKLFGREGQALIPVLAQGSAHLREVYGEFGKLGGGMSDEFVKSAKETQDEIDKIKFALESMKVRIVSAVLPAVQWLTAKIKALAIPILDWLDHTSVLRTGLLALSAVLSGKVVISIIKLARVMGILKATVWETVKAFLGFALPLIGIGLLYLAFDDLFTLLSGGDSEIGHLLETFGGVEGKDKYVQDLKDSWQQLLDLLGLGGPEVDDTTEKVSLLAKVVEFLGGAFYEIITTVKLVFDLLVGTANVVKELVLGFTKLGSVNPFGGVGKAIDKTGDMAVNDVKDIWNPGNHPATAGVGGVPGSKYDQGPGTVSVGALQYGAPSVPAPVPVAAAGTHVEKIEVHVEAGKNPEETGKRVAQSASTALEKEKRDAAVNLKRS
jgi:TP901 family phage tail tape measure protein